MLACIAFLTYNQPRFIAKALRSAFAQSYRPLEIVVSDDCSTDETWTTVQALAPECPGDIRLILRRNMFNLSTAANFAAAVEASAGEVIFGWAQDDISAPCRVARTLEAFSDPGVMAVAAACSVIDEDGRPLNQNLDASRQTALSLAISGGAGCHGGSAAYRRATFDDFPSMPIGLLQEDVVLSFRAALIGRIATIDEPLVHYRTHGASVMCSADGRGGRAAFIDQQKRFIRNEVLVRTRQIEDARIVNRPDLLPHLTRHLRTALLANSIARKEPDIVTHFFQSVTSGDLSARSLGKLAFTYGAPGLWHSWINRRQ